MTLIKISKMVYWLCFLQLVFLVQATVAEVHPVTFLTEYPPPECKSENLDNIIRLANGNSCLIMNSCSGAICSGSTLRNLEVCLTKLKEKNVEVFMQVMADSNITSIINQWGNIENVQGLYFYDVLEVSFNNSGRVSEIVEYINTARSVGLDTIVNVNSIPHMNISNAAIGVNVYDGDLLSFTEDCLEYGPGPFCRIAKTDLADIALNHLINVSSAQVMSYIGYDETGPDESDFPRLLDLAEQFGITILSVSQTAPWQMIDVDYLTSFRTIFGNDCENKDNLCNSGSCSDPDSVENVMYECTCTSEYSGKNCQHTCTCPDEFIVDVGCTETSNATCVAAIGDDCDNNDDDLCGTGTCSDSDGIVNNNYQCSCPSTRSGSNCEFKCDCDDGLVVNEQCTDSSHVICANQYTKTSPMTILFNSPEGQSDTECDDSAYQVIIEANKDRGDAIVIIGACSDSSFTCSDETKRKLQICINAIGATGSSVYLSIESQYEKWIEEFPEDYENVSGYYIHQIGSLSYHDFSGVDTVLEYIQEINGHDLQVIVATNGIPHRRISEVADYVMVYDGGSMGILNNCGDFGPGPYCFESKTDESIASLDYLNSPDSKAAPVAHVGYSDDVSGSVAYEKIGDFIDLAEQNNLFYVSLCDVSPWLFPNATFLDAFYTQAGSDDCTRGPCLNSGVCSDVDREINDVYNCECSNGFEGYSCEHSCTCEAGSVPTEACTNLTDAVCQECETDYFVENDACQDCPTDSFCFGGIQTVCLNGTYVGNYSCLSCELGFFCTNGLSQECPDGFHTYEIGQSSCVPCVDGVCDNDSSRTNIIIIVGSVVGGLLLIIVVICVAFWYRRHQEKKNEPKLPKNMTAEDFALQTDDEFLASEAGMAESANSPKPAAIEYMNPYNSVDRSPDLDPNSEYSGLDATNPSALSNEYANTHLQQYDDPQHPSPKSLISAPSSSCDVTYPAPGVLYNSLVFSEQQKNVEYYESPDWEGVDSENREQTGDYEGTDSDEEHQVFNPNSYETAGPVLYSEIERAGTIDSDSRPFYLAHHDYTDLNEQNSQTQLMNCAGDLDQGSRAIAEDLDYSNEENQDQNNANEGNYNSNDSGNLEYHNI